MYSKENYRLLIAHLKEVGYQFYDFANDLPLGTKSVFLRHDVEWNPTAALALAQENHKLGVLGTFFFNFRSGRYNLMAHRDEVASIQALGQQIGLIYDPINRRQDDKTPMAGVKEEFEIFQEIIPGAKDIFVWSDTSKTLVEGFGDQLIPGMSNLDSLNATSVFVDTEANFSFNELVSFIDKQYPKIMLSLHPDFWIAGGKNAQKLSQNIKNFRFKGFKFSDLFSG